MSERWPLVPLERLLECVGRFAGRRGLDEDKQQLARIYAWRRWQRDGGRVYVVGLARWSCMYAIKTDVFAWGNERSGVNDAYSPRAVRVHWAEYLADRRAERPDRIAERTDWIETALASLAKRDVRALRMIGEGWTREEAARAQGRSPRWIARVIRRARRRLIALAGQ